MVDATLTDGAVLPARLPLDRAERARSRVRVGAADARSLADYDAVARDGIHAQAQGSAWTRTWIDTMQPDAIVATIFEGERPVFALALEIARQGPFKVARLPGGTHANGNFPPSDARWAAGAPEAAIAELAAEIRRVRPDIDVLALERLMLALEGARNPLLGLPSSASPNPSLAVDLTGGFEALMARSNGKRRRKKHRSQTRKFEAAGELRRVEASSPQEVDRILDDFFAMKASRFKQAGIANVFEDVKVQAFFRTLFTDALRLSPKPFVLHALEVGGKLRAITGASRLPDRLVCEFGAIVDDELSHASPGDFLFFENIMEACTQGLAVYDFSVGDEPYKRLWCDIETRHADVLMTLSTKGRILVATLGVIARAKARLKGNRRLWTIVKGLRRRTAGKTAAPASEPAED